MYWSSSPYASTMMISMVRFRSRSSRGVLGIGVKLCRPGDPETKGLVERANGYLETSFLPGRSFGSPAEFNAQLQTWLGKANARVHRSIDAEPADRWEPERAAMLPLPPVPPQVGWQASLRLPRDHYVRVDANDYSVDPAVIGRPRSPPKPTPLSHPLPRLRTWTRLRI